MSTAASAAPTVVRYTVFPDITGRFKKEISLPLRELAEGIRTREALKKGELPLIKLARFGYKRSDKDSLRTDENLQCITGVEVECDNGSMSFDEVIRLLRAANITSIAHTTWSHTEEHPRWRVLAFLSREHLPEAHKRFVDELNELLRGTVSDECWTLSQAYFYGHKAGSQNHRVELIEGVPLDLHTGSDQRSKATATRAGATNPPAMPSNLVRLGPRPANVAGYDRTLAENASNWPSPFSTLTPEQKNALIGEILKMPEIAAIADRSRREGWLDVLFALADAEHQGATEARQLALDWSAASPRFKDEADFDRDWQSFDPDRPGRITVGTLLALARDHGFDFARWFNAEAGHPDPAQATTGPSAAPAAWAALQPIMDEGTAGAQLNQLLGFSRQFGNEPSYFMRSPEGVVLPINHTGLQALLASYRVRTGAGKSQELVPAAKWWSQWSGRYTVDLVAYDPEETYQQRGITIENPWRGFAIRPTPGSWAIMDAHLRQVICGGNRTYFTYLLHSFAHAVQRPGTSPEIMIVLRSTSEGVGKSAVGIAMARMFGVHGHIASSASEIFGEFNEVIADKSFIMLEEAAFPGDHKLAAALKNTITAPVLSINPKGRQRYTIGNRLHLLLCTNELWCVPAGADARRFFVLDVTRKEDARYFNALYHELNHGGAEAMLYDLLRVDISGFKPRDVPVTPALVQQQRLSTDDITVWALDCVVAGSIRPPAKQGDAEDNGFGGVVPSSDLYESYCFSVRTQGGRHPRSHVEFGRALTQLGFVRGRSNNPPCWEVPRGHELYTAAHERARIRQVTL